MSVSRNPLRMAFTDRPPGQPWGGVQRVRVGRQREAGVPVAAGVFPEGLRQPPGAPAVRAGLQLPARCVFRVFVL